MINRSFNVSCNLCRDVDDFLHVHESLTGRAMHLIELMISVGLELNA